MNFYIFHFRISPVSMPVPFQPFSAIVKSSSLPSSFNLKYLDIHYFSLMFFLSLVPLIFWFAHFSPLIYIKLPLLNRYWSPSYKYWVGDLYLCHHKSFPLKSDFPFLFYWLYIDLYVFFWSSHFSSNLVVCLLLASL